MGGLWREGVERSRELHFFSICFASFLQGAERLCVDFPILDSISA
jgi:hypothetical protein